MPIEQLSTQKAQDHFNNIKKVYDALSQITVTIRKVIDDKTVTENQFIEHLSDSVITEHGLFVLQNSDKSKDVVRQYVTEQYGSTPLSDDAQRLEKSLNIFKKIIDLYETESSYTKSLIEQIRLFTNYVAQTEDKSLIDYDKDVEKFCEQSAVSMKEVLSDDDKEQIRKFIANIVFPDYDICGEFLPTAPRKGSSTTSIFFGLMTCKNCNNNMSCHKPCSKFETCPDPTGSTFGFCNACFIMKPLHNTCEELKTVNDSSDCASCGLDAYLHKQKIGENSCENFIKSRNHSYCNYCLFPSQYHEYTEWYMKLNSSVRDIIDDLQKEIIFQHTNILEGYVASLHKKIIDATIVLNMGEKNHQKIMTMLKSDQ